jgi:hypothetical protein
VFERFRRREVPPSVLDPVIKQAVSEMEGFDADSAEFKRSADSLKVLMEAKAAEPKPDKVSANTMAVVIANIAGIVLILMSERANVITSKALGFIMKPKSQS